MKQLFSIILLCSTFFAFTSFKTVQPKVPVTITAYGTNTSSLSANVTIGTASFSLPPSSSDSSSITYDTENCFAIDVEITSPRSNSVNVDIYLDGVLWITTSVSRSSPYAVLVCTSPTTSVRVNIRP